MKIIPVASPHAVAPTQSNAQAQQAARARAIATLQGSESAPVVEAPIAAQSQSRTGSEIVRNQSQVAVEELGAITQPSRAEDTEQTDESTDVEAPAQPEQPDKLSRQWAQLSRHEKQLRNQAKALKAREVELAAREAKLTEPSQQAKPDYSNYIDRQRLAQDPLGALAEAGVSYDSLVQQALNQQPTDPRVLQTIDSLKAQISELKQSAEDSKKSYADNQKQAYQAAVKQIRTDVINLVKTDPTYEAIRATKSVDDVVDLITKTYETDGIVMTAEQAAEEVESYLVEEATRLANLNKIKSRIQANSTKPVSNQAQTRPTAPKQTQRTLTNDIGSTRQMTARERAVAAFEGRLK